MTIPVLQNTSRLANLLSQPQSIPASLSASGPTIRRVVRIMPQLGDVIVSPALVDTYAALNIIGIALLTLLTITFLIAPRKKLHRDPTLINAFVVLIWVGVWNIVYWAAVGTDIGVWESARRPKRRLCEVQSYVLAGSQPAQAATVFALTFRVRLWPAKSRSSTSPSCPLTPSCGYRPSSSACRGSAASSRDSCSWR